MLSYVVCIETEKQVEDGDIRKVESHDELMKRRGLYAAMYESGASMG